jgi:hypothetical protein
MKGDAASTTFISSPKSVLSDLLANHTHASILYLFDPLHNIIKRSACFRSRLFFAITEGNHDRDGKVSGNWVGAHKRRVNRQVADDEKAGR